MRVTPRFTIRAALVVTAAGVIGAFGACKDNNVVGPPPPPPPPPPPAVAAPSGLAATPVGTTGINLTWTDNATNETGFRIQRCSGAGCTAFTTVKDTTAANLTSYSDTGLTASTSYSYQVRAFNATDSSLASNTASATTGAIGTSTFTMVGAGEITNCATTASIATGNTVKGILDADTSAIAFTAGNNLSDSLPNTTYADCYAPKWGAFKDRTIFAIGNGDYLGGRGPAGVYAYLGDKTKGPDGKGWYSLDKGNWHIIVLNTADWEQTTAQLQDPNGPMNTWLAADLAAVPASKCIMAISWNRRIYTTGDGELGLQFNLKQAASLLYAAHADLLVSGYEHIYARFPKTDNNGVAAADGFRQFIVGTGGQSLHKTVTPADKSGNTLPISPVEVQEGNNTANGDNGVIKFTMHDNSYEWEFIPTLAGKFTDKSSAPVSCNQ